MKQIINNYGVTIIAFEDETILLSGIVGESEVQLLFKNEEELKKKIKKKIDNIDCIDLINYRNKATK